MIAHTTPATSVLSPISRSPSRYTQLTEPNRSAIGVRPSRASITVCLWGIVTDMPANPKARIAATAAGPSSAPTRSAT